MNPYRLRLVRRLPADTNRIPCLFLTEQSMHYTQRNFSYICIVSIVPKSVSKMAEILQSVTEYHVINICYYGQQSDGMEYWKIRLS